MGTDEEIDRDVLSGRDLRPTRRTRERGLGAACRTLQVLSSAIEMRGERLAGAGRNLVRQRLDDDPGVRQEEIEVLRGLERRICGQFSVDYAIGGEYY